MWMQALEAAGIPVFGERFPRDWGDALRDANPRGFYESILRRGIYWETNPHPRTGAYLFPEQVTGWAVKVFVPGVIRTDRAYIERVVATMRPWREYVASIQRLTAIEEEARDRTIARPVLAPELEWWHENYVLIRDVLTRRYAFHFVAYDRILRDPEATFRKVFEWIGKGDADAAAAVIEPSLRTQSAPTIETDLQDATKETFDALYDHIARERPMDAPFVERMNETNEALLPRMQAYQREVAAWHRQRSAGER